MLTSKTPFSRRIEIGEALALWAEPYLSGGILAKSGHDIRPNDSVGRSQLLASVQLQLRPLKTEQTPVSSDPPISVPILDDAFIEIAEGQHLRFPERHGFLFDNLDQSAVLNAREDLPVHIFDHLPDILIRQPLGLGEADDQLAGELAHPAALSANPQIAIAIFDQGQDIAIAQPLNTRVESLLSLNHCSGRKASVFREGV